MSLGNMFLHLAHCVVAVHFYQKPNVTNSLFSNHSWSSVVTMVTSSLLRMRLLNNVERAGQTTSTPLQHSEHSREQKKCWTDVEAKFKGFKLFQHWYNFASTRFKRAERGWQTLSTLPFNKIERMLKQMLKPFARALSRMGNWLS